MQQRARRQGSLLSVPERLRVIAKRRPRGLHAPWPKRTAGRKSICRLYVGVSLCVVAAVLPALTSGAGSPQEPEANTFRAGVEVFRLPVTVRGPDDRLVTGLSRDDFRIFVGGRPTAIDVFSDRTQALAVALLFNTWTDGEVLERYRSIGRAFVDALEPSDRATIGSFSHEIAISPFVTGDRTVLHRVLAEELWHGWGNPLGTAVDVALTPLANQGGKRVVVVVGPDRQPDCLFDQPCVGIGATTARARGEEVSVFGVRVQTSGYSQSGAGAVREMALRTGGGYLRLQPSDNLSEAIGEVVRALRHEYILGFTASIGLPSQRVEVRAIPGSTVWLGRRLSAGSR